jgi:hypothetical protein
MKNLGIVLIVIGLVLLIIRGFNYTQEEEVVDIGRLEVNKEETRTVSWPLYVGGITVIAGLVLVLSGRKNK